MMDAKAALDYMRSGKGLGIRSGRIDCYMIDDTMIECDNPNGKDTIDVSADDFLEYFARNHFRQLTTEDYAK